MWGLGQGQRRSSVASYMQEEVVVLEFLDNVAVSSTY